MADDTKGISRGGSEGTEVAREEPPAEGIQRFEEIPASLPEGLRGIEDLSDLREFLEDKLGLKGIARETEEGEVAIRRSRQAVRDILRQDKTVIINNNQTTVNNSTTDIDQDITESETTVNETEQTINENEIDSTSERLLNLIADRLAVISSKLSLVATLSRQISINTSSTVDYLDDVRGGIAEITRLSAKGQELTVKDTDFTTISNEDQAVDVVDEDDVTTAVVLVKAPSDNQQSLWVGDSDAGVEEGFQLEPGEKEVFPVDISIDVFQIAASNAGDRFSYVAFGVSEA